MNPRPPLSLLMRGAAASLAAGALIGAAATSGVAAAPESVGTNDATGDVVTTGQVSASVELATDLRSVDVYRGSPSGRVVVDLDLSGDIPRADEGRMSYLVKLRVEQKPQKKHGKTIKRKPFTMKLEFLPTDPQRPFRISNDRSGKMKAQGCSDIAYGIDHPGLYHYNPYVALAPRCFGRHSVAAGGTLLVTGKDTVHGGVAKDGASVPRFSVR